jgi:DNA-binding NtrC family response regulator
MSRTILLVDDEPKMRDVLGSALEGFGYRVHSAADGVAALTVLEQEEIDLVLTDLRMPRMTGRELLLAVHERAPQLPVVLMTAYGDIRDAVEAMRVGAFDYLTKPFDIDEVAAVLAKALHLHDVLRENVRLRRELEGRHQFGALVGATPAFRKVIEAVAAVAETKANVLITGESGTGKEVVARAIHFNSGRRERPFVALNCAAIPETLLESELFGHVKGAFTGALAARPGRFVQADGGTLFLDEIGEMPVALQVKILRALQERIVEPVGGSQARNVDVRVIAATNRDLEAAVRARSFREDLYYRLNVFPIRLPALRERRDDIVLLAEHFVRQLAADMGKRVVAISPAAIDALAAYAWPGNIRELQNAIERAIILARQPVLDVVDLPAQLFERPAARQQGEDDDALPPDLDRALEDIERRFILRALGETGGVQVKAAERLGINERSLWHRIKKLGIQIVKHPTSP